MKEEKFKESDIPYQDFAKLGYTREKIMSLPKDELEQLLSGKRTSLMTINKIDGIEQDVNIKAKFSLKRDLDGNVKLMVHPVNESIKNDIHLTTHEINKLKEGINIVKKIDDEKYMIQLDRDNNELLKVKAKDINIPTHIGNIELSSNQREHLKQGNPITLESPDYKINVSVDLNSRSGLKVENLKDMTMDEKIAFDRVNPGVISYLQTDENRNDYMRAQRELQNDNQHHIKIN